MKAMHGKIRRRPNAHLGFAGLRAHPRRAMGVEVLIQDCQGWEMPVESVDFSAGGIFVRTPFLLEKGTVQTLIFGHPEGDDQFAVRAEVVRVQDDREALDGASDYTPGMAFRFLSVVDRKRDRLREFAVRG